jgi:hypothetical protein
MQLALTDAESALVTQWREFTKDQAASARTAWTRQGWLPRSLVEAAPAGCAARPGQHPGADDAVSIMASARLHEGAPEVLASAMIGRFVEAAPAPAAPHPPAYSMNAVRLILPWWAGEGDEAGTSTVPVSLAFLRNGTVRGQGFTGTGIVLAGDASAARAWLVAADPAGGPGGGCVVETAFPPSGLPGPARAGPDGYQTGRDHQRYRRDVPDGTGAGAVWPLDPGQFAALRDLVRIAGACVLVGLIDTVFDAIVAQARNLAAASGDRWAGQSDKHRAVEIATCRETARLHLFRALDAFGRPGERAMFGALALTEAAGGLGQALAERRMIGRRHGDEDALAAVDLAATQHDLWLDLAGGSGALAATVSEAQLGRRDRARPA